MPHPKIFVNARVLLLLIFFSFSGTSKSKNKPGSRWVVQESVNFGIGNCGHCGAADCGKLFERNLIPG
jgi:hypothetical protein